MKSLSIKLLGFLLLLLTTAAATAQTGTLRFTVFEAATGETLYGATVRLIEIDKGAVTDLDGKAALIEVPVGTYTAEVSFVTFQKQMIEGITIEAGKTAAFEVKLEEENNQLEEVVVTAKALQNSESALLTVQRKSAKMLDAVASESFSRNGDNDAAAAVSRVVGVTVEGGKYVYVRGLGDRYSKAILNGAEIPGLDPERNSVQMDLFPSNLIDNITVYKTFSPDLPGEFTGGLVNVITKDFPDRFTLQASASIGVNDQAHLSNEFITYDGGGTDFLGFDDGTRDLPEELTRYEFDNFPQRFASPNAEVNEVTRSFDNYNFNPYAASPSPNVSLSLSTGNQFQVANRPLGFVAGLTYRLSSSGYDNGQVNRFQGISTNTGDLYSDLIFANEDQAGTQEATIGAIFNTAYKPSDNIKIGMNLMFNQAGNKFARYQEGFRIDNQPDSTLMSQVRVLQWTERTLGSGQLNFEANIPSLNNTVVEGFVMYTNSRMDEPDLRFGNNSIRNGNFEINNLDLPARFFRDMNEDVTDSKINFTLPTGEGNTKLKVGGAFTTWDRSYREERYEFLARRNNLDITNALIEDYDALYSIENLGFSPEGREQITLTNGTQPSNIYNADRSIAAAYAMLEFNLTEKLSGTAGLRVEHTEQKLISADPEVGNEGVVDYDPFTDFLPAVNLKYALTERTNVRASATRTVARPTFRELAPLSTFGFQSDFIQNGNPDLKRTQITNLDLRFESYPTTQSYWGASVFIKDFTNPIENTIDPRSGGSQRQYIFRNVDQAFVAGLELEMRKELGFIAPWAENFRLNTNVTIMTSSVDLAERELNAIKAFNPEQESTRAMFNQSPFVVNAGLLYENSAKGFSMNAAFNVFGRRLVLVQTDLPFVYEQPRPDLNFSFRKRIGEHWGATFRANNLLNPDFRTFMEYQGVEYDYDRMASGRTFSIGVNYLIE